MAMDEIISQTLKHFREDDKMSVFEKIQHYEISRKLVFAKRFKHDCENVFSKILIQEFRNYATYVCCESNNDPNDVSCKE